MLEEESKLQKWHYAIFIVANQFGNLLSKLPLPLYHKDVVILLLLCKGRGGELFYYTLVQYMVIQWFYLSINFIFIV